MRELPLTMPVPQLAQILAHASFGLWVTVTCAVLCSRQLFSSSSHFPPIILQIRQRVAPPVACRSNLPWCHKEPCGSCAVVGLCDVIAVIFLLYSRRHFKLAVEKYEHEYDASVLEIADYTVLVTGLPKDISPSQADTALVEYAQSELCSTFLSGLQTFDLWGEHLQTCPAPTSCSDGIC